MKQSLSLKLGSSLFVIALVAMPAFAQCSNATVVGTYRYIWNGYGFTSSGPEDRPQLITKSAPFAAVGLTTFNSDGTSSNTDTISLGGQIIPRSFTNTYSIGSDCRGTITAEGNTEPTAHLVAATDGSEIFFINSFNGVTISGYYKRQ